MAMATYDIMPPPVSVGGGLGEVRTSQTLWFQALVLFLN
jgi:hypothetical protein